MSPQAYLGSGYDPFGVQGSAGAAPGLVQGLFPLGATHLGYAPGCMLTIPEGVPVSSLPTGLSEPEGEGWVPGSVALAVVSLGTAIPGGS